MTLTDYMGQGKKVQEDLLALKIVWMHQMTNYSNKKQHKQHKDQQKLVGNRNVKKNNCMDISSDKLTKSHTRRLGHG